MIVSLIVHMFSVLLLKAYRPPRELTWVSGYALFVLALCFGFSGYLLPWNELAYFATSVGTDSVKSVPVVGQWVLEVLRGGPDVTINTLYRFFSFHVVILPLAIVGLISLHLLFIQRQGMAPPIDDHGSGRGMKFFPNFAMRDLLLWLGCLLILLLLAVFLPYGAGVPGMEWQLGLKADPLAPAYPGIKPEWYFLWVYQLLKEFPPHILGLEGPQLCLLIVSVLGVFWGLIPWLDRRARADRQSPEFSDLGFAAVFFLLFLMLKAWDIGATKGAAEAANLMAVARSCAWIVVVLAAVVTVVRATVYQHRWFLLSGTEVLHVVLHGFMGFSYLGAAVIACILGSVAIFVSLWRAASSGGVARE